MNTTMLLRAAVGAVAAASLLAGHTPAAHAQTPPCQFRLGFADLAQLLTARGVVVGPCREDQHPTPNGDAEQRTTRGLMVWRAADNWTAFTDGHQTWVNGPNGLEARLNTQRFSWEPDAGAAGTAVVGVSAPEPPALVPGTQLGVPVSGPTLTMTATGIVRVPGATPGNRLVKVTLKLEGGENSARLGKYDSWHFRLRSPQGVEYRPSVLESGRPGALRDGRLARDQFVVGDLYFEVPDDGVGYGLHYYPDGYTHATLAISRWLGGTA